MTEPLNDYDGREWRDPLVRCYNCSKLVHRAYIAVNAGCNHCGNKRFQTLRALDDELEIKPLHDQSYDLGMKSYTIDEGFLSIFAIPPK